MNIINAAVLFHNQASTHSTHETDLIYSRARDMGKMKGKQKQVQADSNVCVCVCVN